MSPSPASLVARIRSAESVAEEELVLLYRRGVSVIIGRIVADRTLVEDLAQDALRIAIEKIRAGVVREPEKLSGFICGVARSIALDHVRKPRRELPIEEAAPLASAKENQLARVLRRERAAMVRQVLGELAQSRDRQVLYRFYILEETREAICSALALTALQFNRVLHRALGRYRELYKKRVGSGIE